jgi:hypothetical protein
MKSRQDVMKRWLAFALALSVGSLSLGCMTICAAHAERSSCASDETGVTLTGEEDECCSLNALRSLPPDRMQKSPVGIIARPLPPDPIFGFHQHDQGLIPIAISTQPTCSPPLQRSHALRI